MKKYFGALMLLAVAGAYAETGSISGAVTLSDFDGESWTGTVAVFSPKGEVWGATALEPSIDSATGKVSSSASYIIDKLTPDVSCYILVAVEGYLPQYYDHTYSIEEAAQVQLTAEGIDFELERGPDITQPGAVSGFIQGPTGPLPFSSIYAKKGESVVAGQISSKDGTYRLSGLEPGEYLIYATRAGYKTGEYAKSITISDKEVSDIAISLEPVPLPEEEHKPLEETPEEEYKPF
jgi:hypothetical protein